MKYFALHKQVIIYNNTTMSLLSIMILFSSIPLIYKSTYIIKHSNQFILSHLLLTHDYLLNGFFNNVNPSLNPMTRDPIEKTADIIETGTGIPK